ncbi:hypothetical protein ABK040_007221 [Willaertia magna]
MNYYYDYYEEPVQYAVVVKIEKKVKGYTFVVVKVINDGRRLTRNIKGPIQLGDVIALKESETNSDPSGYKF